MKSSFFIKIFTLLSSFFIVIDGFAQADVSPFFFSIDYRKGKNVPHRSVVENLHYPYYGVDLKMGWQTIGKQDWQRAFRYPSLGVGVNWNTFKTEILGEPVAAYFFTNFPQITASWFRIDLEVDFGLSYGINPYNKLTNPDNFSTGSSLNAFFGLYLEQSVHLSPQVDFFVSEGITHYSNGALGWPNIGLNIPSMKFGIRYLNEPPAYIRDRPKPSYERGFSLVTNLSGGTKKLYAPTPSYHEVSISSSVFYRSGYKRRVGAGAEVAYNEVLKGVSLNEKYPMADLMTMSVHVSHEFLIDRFTILSQLGVYLKNQPTDKFYYERIGFGYYFWRNFRVLLNIKAHYIKAEYVEAGISYDLELK
ncbi:MAG TPA: acyloxyacyl hydrolase [Prolixibacteraceae bacterium]|nr:acyloxyacyl hydrolase [Prolixibacteraceae bacterium]HPS12327.1 acyloxyacyl hydrolase [Prolixibacteraceae bacterium]